MINISIRIIFSAQSDPKRFIELAKIAEQAERYDDTAEAIKQVKQKLSDRFSIVNKHASTERYWMLK